MPARADQHFISLRLLKTHTPGMPARADQHFISLRLLKTHTPGKPSEGSPAFHFVAPAQNTHPRQTGDGRPTSVSLRLLNIHMPRCMTDLIICCHSILERMAEAIVLSP
jgi:hypothetical protein